MSNELHSNQTYPSTAKHFLNNIIDNLTSWFKGDSLPKKEGWYLVVHSNLSHWISTDGVFCYFDGKDFIRPCGWPAPPNDNIKYMRLNEKGILQLPPVTLEYLTVINGKKVIPIRWCGYLTY